ncbi:unnamed protein product [Amoebophrya sp. A120]|nr:unnamed protein product [Amoebophrya sp. A120]|eukprot:GSA120T00000187001.1
MGNAPRKNPGGVTERGKSPERGGGDVGGAQGSTTSGSAAVSSTTPPAGAAGPAQQLPQSMQSAVSHDFPNENINETQQAGGPGGVVSNAKTNVSANALRQMNKGQKAGNKDEETTAASTATKSANVADPPNVVQQDGLELQLSGGSSEQDPLQGGAAATTARRPSHASDTVSVVFTWTHGGQNVFLIGSFNNWSERIPMVRSGLEFHCVVELTRQEHQYKFVADEQWRYSSDYPIVSDDLGNIHNIMDVTHYEPYDLFKIPDNERVDNLPFTQVMPDFTAYATEPPTIPVVLAKSAFVAVDPPVEKMPPNIPLHSISHHMYHDFTRTLRPRVRRRLLDGSLVPANNEELRVRLKAAYAHEQGEQLSIPGIKSETDKEIWEKEKFANLFDEQNRVLCTAVTSRYESKYTTTIFITRGNSWAKDYHKDPKVPYWAACNPLLQGMKFHPGEVRGKIDSCTIAPLLLFPSLTSIIWRA